MKPSTRRTTTQGAANVLNIASGAAQRFAPAFDLDPAAISHFHAIIASRDLESWSPHDLILATQLAEAHHLRSQALKEMAKMGFTYETLNGNVAVNPLFQITYSLQTSIAMLTKALGISAPQRGLTSGASRKMAEDQRRASTQVADLKDSDRHNLLAFPESDARR